MSDREKLPSRCSSTYFRVKKRILTRNRSAECSDIAASAMAVATRRVPWAARAVAVTGAMDFALHDDAVAVMAVMAVDEEGEEGGDEEEDDVPGLTISKPLKSV
jgi:hypothetical protein